MILYFLHSSVYYNLNPYVQFYVGVIGPSLKAESCLLQWNPDITLHHEHVTPVNLTRRAREQAQKESHSITNVRGTASQPALPQCKTSLWLPCQSCQKVKCRQSVVKPRQFTCCRLARHHPLNNPPRVHLLSPVTCFCLSPIESTSWHQQIGHHLPKWATCVDLYRWC